MELDNIQNRLTPIFPDTSKEVSEDVLQKDKCYKIFKIETDKRISKSGDKITIDGIVTDISKMSLYDLTLFLKEQGLNVKLYHYKNLSALTPAILVNDFSNYKQYSLNPSTNPFHFQHLIHVQNNTLHSYKHQFTDFQMFSGDQLTLPIPFSEINNRIFYQNSSNAVFFYSIQDLDFDITLSVTTFKTGTPSSLYRFTNIGS